ncbi:phage holin family protein [Geodermatophilus sp. YIM 151500]|uniref:phage holin family protein n=1 Tax=Geodermatophilus sp. YIM 151500 TaxID=2984531 RepID=UPI0021E3E837|nr:phage holin family protein [Geodermatophilus sp. YIM 151500]MCV2491032.1 phage holin family protein [Geodermatophilus sp. YIM 151500]
MAQTVPAHRTARTDDSSIGTLVQSAMADVSVLVRGEIELAKTELTRSVKRAGVGIAAFVVAGVVLLFSLIFLLVALAEGLTALGLYRWLSYLLVWLLLALVAAVAGLVGLRALKKIEKPERTLESLRDLPEVLHREAPGQRRRDLPTVEQGRVERRSPDSYLV